MSTRTDEEQIRQLVATWMAATASGDVDTVLGLMTDDAVFLVAGRPPMHKQEFAAQSRAQAGAAAPRIEGHSDIQEIQVCGDWAWMRSQLQVSVTPPGGAAPMQRAGPTLTVFRKEGGRWKLSRDANLLTPLKT